MDTSVAHALEIGLSFILFVIAISTFILMYGQTLALVDVARSTNNTEEQVAVYVGEVNEAMTSLEDIYSLLTEGDLGGKEHWVNDRRYLSSLNRVKIIIDGVDYSPVKDYKGQESLRESLLLLGSRSFDKDYYVDDQGKLIEIHFTGR